MKKLIKRILKESIEEIEKERVLKLIEKKGILGTLNFLNMDIFELANMLNTTPMELIRKNLIGKKLNNTDFNVRNGGYNFNFIITDIDEHEGFWSIYVEILDGTVDLIMTYGETYDLWDSDLWEKDFWWEIQNEIDDIIYDILRPYKPSEIRIKEIHHNLR